MSTYPEHDKLSAVQSRSQAIGAFLEWLGEQGIELASYHKHSEACNDSEPCKMGTQRLWPIRHTIQSLLAEYFEIDLNVLENEKRAMLDEMRALNGETG